MNKSASAQRGLARTQRPERTQVEMHFHSLDQMIEPNHRVRYVWQYVESLDLSPLYQNIKAAGSKAGRNPIDPRILFSLWLFATIEGISSARWLDDQCTRNFPYIWILGGVSVNYHTLADFRAQNGDLLEQLMIDSVAVLLQHDLITLDTLAQDGMRVRASAGTDSFRRKPTLEAALEEATRHCEEVKKRGEEDSRTDNKRQQAAQQRAAQEKAERIAEAIEQLDELNGKREQKKRDTENTRASMTDPDARRMKMGDGGFRPALNVQFSTDRDTRIIVGADVTNSGGDSGQMAPMHEKIVDDYGVVPKNYLVDGPFVTHMDVDQLESGGTEVFGPVPGQKRAEKEGKDPHARKRNDSDQMANFRQRMSTDAAKLTYQDRPSVAEFPNAGCRNRGLGQFRVRGLFKAKAQSLWQVHAHNFLRFLKLGYLETLQGAC